MCALIEGGREYVGRERGIATHSLSELLRSYLQGCQRVTHLFEGGREVGVTSLVALRREGDEPQAAPG